MTRRYAIVSIVLNVILLLIYFGYFHSRNSFKGKDSIQRTLEMNNKILIKNQESQIDAASEILQFKPRLNETVSDEFCENEICISNFSKIIDKYIHRNITKNVMNEIFKSYNYNINQLNISYVKNMTRSQKEAKIRDKELDEIINSFHLKINNNLRLNKNDLSHLSISEIKLILRVMQNHLIQLQNQANNDFESHLVYSQGCNFMVNRFEPIVFTFKDYIRKGNNLEIDIGLVDYYDRKHNDYCRVDFEGVKLNASADHRYLLSLTPPSIGNKKHELILSWVDPISKEIKMDTTYFEYNVTL